MFGPASGSRYSKIWVRYPHLSPLLVNTAQSSSTARVRSPAPCIPAMRLIISQILLGELRHINKILYWPTRLHPARQVFLKEADTITSFFTPMLRLHPDKRTKASDLLHHNWLDGVLVQGEIDVTRHAEEGGDGRQGVVVSLLEGTCRPTQSFKAILDQSEADAMKPVQF